MEDPIFVTGNARQGTTFIQWLLSLHPNIYIHGQELVPWRTFITFHMHLANAGVEVEKRNKAQQYPIPHWAGSNPVETTEAFKELVYKYFSGQGQHRKKWGLKHLWIPGDIELLDRIKLIYPQSKWVVCCRHPFVSYESQRNTFIKNQDITEWLRNWVMSVRLGKREDSFLVQVDKLSELSVRRRKTEVKKLFAYLGEEPTDGVNKFVKEWPVVHKVVSDESRIFELDSKIQKEKIRFFPGLREYMEELGYK